MNTLIEIIRSLNTLEDPLVSEPFVEFHLEGDIILFDGNIEIYKETVELLGATYEEIGKYWVVSINKAKCIISFFEIVLGPDSVNLSDEVKEVIY